jgi:hypothetical protein
MTISRPSTCCRISSTTVVAARSTTSIKLPTEPSKTPETIQGCSSGAGAMCMVPSGLPEILRVQGGDIQRFLEASLILHRQTPYPSRALRGGTADMRFLQKHSYESHTESLFSFLDSGDRTAYLSGYSFASRGSPRTGKISVCFLSGPRLYATTNRQIQ